MLAQPTSSASRFNLRAAAEGWPALCDDRLDLQSPKLAALLAIWRAVTGERTMPRREDFTARILARHLRDITFVERNGARYRFRLFGSALAEMTGDWTGKFLDEAVPAQFLPSWTATYDAALEAAAPLRFAARFRASQLEHVMAETLVAPLAGESGAASGLLVSVAYSPVVA
jgi:hypothetical protein